MTLNTPPPWHRRQRRAAWQNAELIAGDGTAAHLTGFLSTTGILTATIGTDTALDAVEKAIASLRTGAALAEANLVVLHPSTFWAVRTSKDSQGRYLLNADPSAEEANQVWGIPVVTTQIAGGTALGLRFALFYTKVHDRILTPLFAADQPQAPPELRAALHTVDQHIDQRFATARLPIAA